MKKLAIACLALSTVVVAGHTQAAKLVNRDKAATSVRIIENGAERTIAIGASQQVDELCKSECEMFIGAETESYAIFANDEIALVEGEPLFKEESPADNAAPKN